MVDKRIEYAKYRREFEKFGDFREYRTMITLRGDRWRHYDDLVLYIAFMVDNNFQLYLHSRIVREEYAIVSVKLINESSPLILSYRGNMEGDLEWVEKTKFTRSFFVPLTHPFAAMPIKD